jgi:hypothetical protein
MSIQVLDIQVDSVITEGKRHTLTNGRVFRTKMATALIITLLVLGKFSSKGNTKVNADIY